MRQVGNSRLKEKSSTITVRIESKTSSDECSEQLEENYSRWIMVIRNKE